MPAASALNFTRADKLGELSPRHRAALQAGRPTVRKSMHTRSRADPASNHIRLDKGSPRKAWSYRPTLKRSEYRRSVYTGKQPSQHRVSGLDKGSLPENQELYVSEAVDLVYIITMRSRRPEPPNSRTASPYLEFDNIDVSRLR